jgi:hypothetical protein
MGVLQSHANATMSTSTTQPFPFLALPLELRESIYSLYFKPADRLVRNAALEAQGFFGGVYQFDFDLYRVNRQMYNEARRVWKRENVFVKIATPWPSAGMYRVYLMATDGRDVVEGETGGIGMCLGVPIKGMARFAGSFCTGHGDRQMLMPFLC